jgi:UDP-N-acetylglucosamine acyltransferase
MLEIKDIMKILPHRYPFLLVDRIIELEEGHRAVGIKNVSINEPFFMGHFPEYPIMPGVLIVEAMAQVAGIILLRMPQAQGKLAFFASIQEVKFRHPVFPGDTLRMEAVILKLKGFSGKVEVKAFVDDKLVAEGTMMCTLVDRAFNETPGFKGTEVHRTAYVHPTAKLGENVKIGPYTIIGEDVVVGDNTTIDAHVVLDKWTTIGRDCHLHYGAVIGDKGQVLKTNNDEKSFVQIGDRNEIREYVTIHRASGEGAATIIGDDNLLMANVHIAHNCRVGNQVVITNVTGLSGHVVVEDQAIIGGMVGIHQHVRIGRLAMVGGYSRVVQDIPPFMLVEGRPAIVRGINSVGMQRRNMPPEIQAEIKKVYKILYRSGLNLTQAMEKIENTVNKYDEVKHLINFVNESERGVCKKQADPAISSEDFIGPTITQFTPSDGQ